MKIVDHQPVVDPSTLSYYQYMQPMKVEKRLLNPQLSGLVDQNTNEKHQHIDGESDLLSYPQVDQ